MFSRQQLSEIWDSNDLLALGQAADAVRKQRHPEGIVTYIRSAEEHVVTRTFKTEESLHERTAALQVLNGSDDLLIFRPLVEPNATGVEYLKTLALARIILDKVPHIQASYSSFGLKVAQIALRFGADDLGKAGGEVSEEELRRIIRDAGFSPKQRDALFRTYSLA